MKLDWRTIATDLREREGAALDDRHWQDWIDLHDPHCEYWVPSWRSEEELTDDPQREISHIYYANRAGLEDRVLRITSGRSPASMPMRRTTHTYGSLTLVSLEDEQGFTFRSGWLCHVYDPRHRSTFALFGTCTYTVSKRSGNWLIVKKKTVIQNDYLPSVVDFNCL